MTYHPTAQEQTLTIPAGSLRLPGDIAVPHGALGLVLFAHGSGSSRRSVRNRFVAEALRAQRLGTLLFDLLTPAEEARDALDGHLRFDIPLLAARLAAVTDWVCAEPSLSELRVGYFGASTGAAAALMAAAERPRKVGAIVSRGGRPDLANHALPRVRAPILLIVGGDDDAVLDLNRQAMEQISAPTRLVIVPGATHLFPEPGALEEVARLAGAFFATELARAPSESSARPAASR